MAPRLCVTGGDEPKPTRKKDVNVKMLHISASRMIVLSVVCASILVAMLILVHAVNELLRYTKIT